jgi:hypothetical protein
VKREAEDSGAGWPATREANGSVVGASAELDGAKSEDGGPSIEEGASCECGAKMSIEEPAEVLL